MQVSVESTGVLERRLTVQLPAERVESEVQDRLRSLARTARIDGFRPGKVPYKIVQKKYQGKVRREVMGELIQSSYQDAVSQQNLRPAGEPAIETRNANPGQPLEFTAVFEIYPQVQLASVAGVKIERPRTLVTEADIDHMLEILRRQRAQWETVDRPAERGDQVLIRYRGQSGDQPAKEARETHVFIAAEGQLEGLAERLIGRRAGDELTDDSTLPEDYPEPALAGKTLQVQIEVLAVNALKIPDLDDTFAQLFGVGEGGLQALRDEVTANMQRELGQAIKTKVKEQVIEALLTAHTIDVPQALIEDETQRLVEKAGGADRVSVKQRENYVGQARRRVALGLLMSEIIKVHSLRASPDKVRLVVEAEASKYEEPDEVIRWYYGSRENLALIEALVLEEQVVEWALNYMDVSEKDITFTELMQPKDMPLPMSERS